MSKTITITETEEEHICLNCNSTNTYLKNGRYPQWYHYKDGYICSRCRLRLIDNPKNTCRRVSFKGRIIMLKQKARSGKCILCWKKIGDKFVKKGYKIGRLQRTSLHHVKYDKNNPLKGTLELCNQCHTTLHWRERKRKKNTI